MVEAVAFHGRYETATRRVKDDDGEAVLTRRQYNERFDVETPAAPELTSAAEHLWAWYFDADRRVSRDVDGAYRLIPPSEWLAWRDITRELVHPGEFAILAAMDRAYSSAVNVEIEAGRELAKRSSNQGK